MATEKLDYYQEVTNDIIKAIEEGTTPWQQGWDSKVGAAIAAVPMNGKTGRPYYKDNLLRLPIMSSPKSLILGHSPNKFTSKPELKMMSSRSIYCRIAEKGYAEQSPLP